MVHIHAEGPAFFCWIPKLFGKRVICTIHGLDWDREKWRGSVASKFIRGGEKNAVKYADEIIVLSKDVQKYFLETYGRETHFIPNGVNRPEVREAKLITDYLGLEKDSYILFLGRLVPEKGIRYLVEAFKNVKTDKKDFYVNKLGFAIVRENFRKERNDWKLDLRVGEGADAIELEIFAEPNPPKRVNRPEACGLRHLAFRVEDVEATVAELEQMGIGCEPIRLDSYTQKKMTFFFDPDGLPLELHE